MNNGIYTIHKGRTKMKLDVEMALKLGIESAVILEYFSELYHAFPEYYFENGITKSVAKIQKDLFLFSCSSINRTLKDLQRWGYISISGKKHKTGNTYELLYFQERYKLLKK